MYLSLEILRFSVLLTLLPESVALVETPPDGALHHRQEEAFTSGAAMSKCLCASVCYKGLDLSDTWFSGC